VKIAIAIHNILELVSFAINGDKIPTHVHEIRHKKRASGETKKIANADTNKITATLTEYQFVGIAR